MTPEQLQAYWDANPQALQAAIASNPSAFGIQPSGMMTTEQVSTQPTQTFQPLTQPLAQPLAQPLTQPLTQPTQTTQQPGLLSDAALMDYWAQNPEALQTATQQDPMAFLSKALQQNFEKYSGYESALQSGQNTGYDPAQFVNDLRMSEDLAYVPGTGSGGEAAQQRFSDAYYDTINLVEQSGMPLINQEGLGLNTGFVYTDGDFIFKPGDGPVGEYNVKPEGRGSDVGNFMLNTGIPLIVAGATAGAFAPAGGAATGTAGTAAGGATGSSGLLSGVSLGSVGQKIGTNALIQAATTGSIDPTSLALAGLTPVVDSQFSQLGGGFLQGAATGATMEGIRGAVTGDFDIGDIAKAGLTSGAQAAAVDFLRDTLQTAEFSPENVAQIEADIEQYSQMTPAERLAMQQSSPVQFARLEAADQLYRNALSGAGPTTEQMARLYQTSDLGKLVGPQGLLGGEYLDTSWLESGINAIGGVLDPVLNWIDNPSFAGMELSPGALDVYQNVLGGVGSAASLGAEGLSYLLTGERPQEPNLAKFPAGTVDEFGTDVGGQYVDPQGIVNYLYSTSQANRYDERFFDTEAPRSEDARYTPGVYEQNPNVFVPPPTQPAQGTQVSQGTQAPIVEGVGEDVSPEEQQGEEAQALPTVPTNQALLDYWEKNPDKLEEAIAANPEAFGLELEDIGEETEAAEEIEEEEDAEQVEEEEEAEEIEEEAEVIEEALPVVETPSGLLTVPTEPTPEPVVAFVPEAETEVEVEPTPVEPPVEQPVEPPTEVVPVQEVTEPETPEVVEVPKVPEVTQPIPEQIEEIVEEDILEDSLSDLLDDGLTEELPGIEPEVEPEIEIEQELEPEPEVQEVPEAIEEVLEEVQEVTDLPTEVPEVAPKVPEVEPETIVEAEDIIEELIKEADVTPDVDEAPEVTTEPDVVPEKLEETPEVEPEVTSEPEPEIAPEPEEPQFEEPEIEVEPEPEIPEEPPVEPPTEPPVEPLTGAPPGLPGIDGVDGLPGLPGVDGQDGLPGLPGTDGEDGLPGVDGTPGVDGEDGEDGEDGKDGMMGGMGGADFKKFMASIDYVAPILRELNIPLTDYISMWIKENK